MTVCEENVAKYCKSEYGLNDSDRYFLRRTSAQARHQHQLTLTYFLSHLLVVIVVMSRDVLPSVCQGSSGSSTPSRLVTATFIQRPISPSVSSQRRQLWHWHKRNQFTNPRTHPTLTGLPHVCYAHFNPVYRSSSASAALPSRVNLLTWHLRHETQEDIECIPRCLVSPSCKNQRRHWQP